MLLTSPTVYSAATPILPPIRCQAQKDRIFFGEQQRVARDASLSGRWLRARRDRDEIHKLVGPPREKKDRLVTWITMKSSNTHRVATVPVRARTEKILTTLCSGLDKIHESGPPRSPHHEFHPLPRLKGAMLGGGNGRVKKTSAPQSFGTSLEEGACRTSLPHKKFEGQLLNVLVKKKAC